MNTIQNSLFRGTKVALGLAVALLTSAVTQAQQALGPMVFSVGTTWREPGTGKDWGYMLWLGNDTKLLLGRTFAVYAKSGAWGRTVTRDGSPEYFWLVIIIYFSMSVALITLF